MCVCCSSELSLPWDPLATSYPAMAATQKRLVCLECPLKAETATADEYQIRETFQKEPDVIGMHSWL